MRLLFFGSDSASLVALRGLHELVKRGKASLDVVCPEAKLVGRGKSRQRQPGPVRAFALEKELKIFDAPLRASTPQKTVTEKGTVRLVEPDSDGWNPPPEYIQSHYDLGVVVSFGYFLPRAIIEAFPRGAVNLHPSILPKYRGAAPIQRCLMNGDEETGVSIIKVDPIAFDSGAILRQERIAVDRMDTYSTLSSKLLHAGTQHLLSVVEDLDSAERQATVQVWNSTLKLPKALKIQPKTRLIDFEKLDATKVWNRWRGLAENGGIASYLDGKRVLLDVLKPPVTPDELLSIIPDANLDCAPGTLIHSKTRIFIACAGRTFVECTMLKREGKTAQTAQSFVNGHLKQSSSACFQLSQSDE